MRPVFIHEETLSHFTLNLFQISLKLTIQYYLNLTILNYTNQLQSLDELA